MQQPNEQLQKLQQENQALKAEVYDVTKAANGLDQTLSSFVQGLSEKLGLDAESETVLDDIYNAVPEPKESSDDVSRD